MLKREGSSAALALGTIEGSPLSGGSGTNTGSPSAPPSVGSIIPPELLNSFTSAMGDAPFMGMLKNLSLNLGSMNLSAMAAGMGDPGAGGGPPEEPCRCSHCLKCSCGRDDRPCCSMDQEGFISKLTGCMKHTHPSGDEPAGAVSPVSGSYAMDISAMRQDEALCAPGGGACLPPLLSQLIAGQLAANPKLGGNPTPVPTPTQLGPLTAGDPSASSCSTSLTNARLLSEAAEYIQRQSESDSSPNSANSSFRAPGAAAGSPSAAAAAAAAAVAAMSSRSAERSPTSSRSAADLFAAGGVSQVCASSEQLLRSAAAGHSGFLADDLRTADLPRRVLSEGDVDLLAMLRQSYETEFTTFSSDDNALKGQPSITALMNIVGVWLQATAKSSRTSR